MWYRYVALVCALLLCAKSSSAQVTELRLKSFGIPEQSGSDCRAPLLVGADGAFYGTTIAGGTTGNGVLFRLSTNGTAYLALHSFGSGNDGKNPYAGLIQANDAALYGTTCNGGSNAAGTVFKMNPDGSGYSVLHHFLSQTDGANPYAGLIQGQDGMLYGTAESGGSKNAGTVFALNTDGSGFKVLRVLGASDGIYPYGALLQASDGVLYGTTHQGGTNGYGTIFKMSPDGSGFSVLRQLNNSVDGGGPYAALIQGVDGGLYGTTSSGGAANYGTVFRITTTGTNFSVVHAFNDGWAMTARAALLQGTDGALYGTPPVELERCSRSTPMARAIVCSVFSPVRMMPSCPGRAWCN